MAVCRGHYIVYIVWRQRPVKGQGGGPFLIPNHDWLPKLICWMPLQCEHRGKGRIAHTPLLIVSERVGREGKPRQRVLERFPTIRSCCIEDGFNRAAWWHWVESVIESWPTYGRDDPRLMDFSRDGPDVLRKLREVVRKPTIRWIAEFDAYRSAREREWKVRDDAYWEGVHRDNLRREEESRRRQEEQARRQWQDAFRDFGSQFGQPSEPDCFEVLGLSPDVTIDQVKARYRELAKQHHPDRGGGDEKEFRRVNEAYERACDLLASRTSA